MILPPLPEPTVILPTVALPVMFAVPVMFAPVPVTTSTLALPTALILTFPLAAGILTLLLPLACGPIKLPAFKLPEIFAVPLIFAPVPVIVNVVLPTAAIVTLPFAVAMLTLLLPLASGPIKLPPVILPVPVITPLPNPKLPTLAFPVVVIVLDPAAIIPIILPPVILPVVVIVLDPAAIIPIILPPVILPVVVIEFEPAAIIPIILPPVILPVPVI